LSEQKVKVWVFRRRHEGIIVEVDFESPLFGEPVELRIETTTDQGTRRPMKVARLLWGFPARTMAELTRVRMDWLNDHTFIFSGIEQGKDGCKNVVSYLQVWLCKLAPPFDRAPLRVQHLYQAGTMEKRSEWRHNGPISMCVELDQELRKMTTRVTTGAPGTSEYHLLDAEIVWLGQDRFQLDGFAIKAQFKDEPAAVHRQSWLCTYDLSVDPSTLDKRGRKLGDCR
jgi:hypothetical protein